MSADKADNPPVKPIVTVPSDRKEAVEEIAGDLFTVIDEKDIPALIRSGTYNVAKFWDDVKANAGKALSINANIFMKRYYEGKEIPKHWATNLQRRLQDFLYGDSDKRTEKVVVRSVKGIPMIYLTVPHKLPEPDADKDADKDKDKDADKGKDKDKDKDAKDKDKGKAAKK